MTIILTILAWLLCGFAGAYIGHRWADKGKMDTKLETVFWMTFSGPFTLLGATIMVIVNSFDFNRVVFKRKSK